MALILDLALAFALQNAAAAIASGDGLRLDNRMVRAAPEAGADVAAYVAVGNEGPDDRLIGVSCACAERAELHRIVRREDGVSMVTDSFLAVPAGNVVEIRPGSDLHLMLIGTRAPLVAGDMVELTLRFEQAGEVTAPFAVVDDTRAAWSAARRALDPDR